MRPLLFALLLVAVAAQAHPGDEYAPLTATSGDVTFYVTPQTHVVKAQRAVLLLGEAVALRDGLYLPMTNATWSLDATGPGDAVIEHQPYGYGFVARANFSAPGTWTLVVQANGTSAQLPLDVYPPTSVRAESSLRSGAFYAGRPSKATFYFLDDATSALVRAEATVTARVQRWENGTKLGEEIVTLSTGPSAGVFSFEHTFPAAGSYIVHVASDEHGIGHEDLPPFEVSVAQARPEEPTEIGRETPGLGAGVIVGASVLLARVIRRQ